MILPASRVYALNDMPLIAQLQGEHNESHYGESLVSLDFDHDGIDDLVVYSYCQKLAKPLNAKSNHGGSDETIACLQTKMLSLRNARHLL